MSYTQTERNAIKKKAKELATILGDDFSDLENQSKDMQTEFFKEYSVEANNRVIQKLMDKKIKLTDDKQEPVKTKTFEPAQPQHSQHQEMENN
ncbi:hypothetical protein [Lactococcus garvieae]